MTQSFDILIVGIGGQGTILASNILGEACLREGRHVKGAETHGMAQRGGSVTMRSMVFPGSCSMSASAFPSYRVSGSNAPREPISTSCQTPVPFRKLLYSFQRF